jgi:hypothetical protein
MKALRTLLAVLLCAAFALAPVASVMAGGASSAQVQPYEGRSGR